MRAVVRVLAIASLVLAMGGCLRQTSYQCAIDNDCGAGGACEATGYCSFADAACPSGRRFGGLSGSLADQCVGGDPAIDGGVVDAIDGSTTDAPPDAPTCPSNYVMMGTSAYRVVTTPATWIAAQNDCVDDGFGTHLVVAADNNEPMLVDTLSAASRTWIGISDRVVPNTWRWVTGAIGPVLPGTVDVGDCGQYFDGTGGGIARLQNRSCMIPVPYVCECDLVANDPTSY